MGKWFVAGDDNWRGRFVGGYVCGGAVHKVLHLVASVRQFV